MSDRIDELWEIVRTACEVIDDEGSTPSRPCTVYGDALTELATIAREAEARALKAEAMVDWLVQYAADCGECPRTRYDEDEDGCRECLDSIRRNAERVIRG